jgi:outer membrane protein OmpA-like peptidoglycan-associated protein
MTHVKSLKAWLGIGWVVIGLTAGNAPAQEKGNEHPWNVSAGEGVVAFEGDFVTKDGFITVGRLGYDLNEWFTLEGSVVLAPDLKGQNYYHQLPDGNWEKINRLQQQAGVDETWMLGLGGDVLYHFTRWSRFDPFLALGAQVVRFGDRFEDYEEWDAAVRGGGGVMYHFNDEWALRADVRGVFAGLGQKGTVSSTYDVGLCWTWGAHVPPSYSVSGGPKDSDGDGLTDAEEAQLGTDPYDKDTDKDGLTDYDEVKVYHTDPLNPDSDYDGLKDGPEVFSYKTNPLDADTDKGGVADGHEVIEDGTNPLNPNDDLIKFELNIQFDYDRAVIKPEYFRDLDVVGKTMQRNPGSTARIEGHCDKLKNSAKRYNEKLSERRAKACLDYLADKCGIERNRMVAVGYGFNRPKAPNDPVSGNPVNRRVEVYIRKADQATATPVVIVEPVKAVPGPEKLAPEPAAK